MQNVHFKDFFWGPDLSSTAGYDTIIQHLDDEKKACKEVEEFMKARALIEEKYAKRLLNLSKKACGDNELNTLKRSLDAFKIRTEHASLSHLQMAENMKDEVKKLEAFREKQKEARKKIEPLMEALHKQKTSQLKKTMDAKKAYERKCRDKEEVDRSLYRNTSTNPKLVEKLQARAQQAKLNVEEAEIFYQQNVITLGKIRDDFLKEHVRACEMFEKLSKEHITFLRNTVWTHLNQLSVQYASSDEMYETVRKSLEQCDVQEDIDCFVNLRGTGNKPPAPVMYESFYTGLRPSTRPGDDPEASTSSQKGATSHYHKEQ